MTLHAVLTVQGNLKGQGMAEGQCLALFNSLVLARMAPGFNPPMLAKTAPGFNSPVLVRTLADLLANLGL
jgi:hypothetical protein